MIPVGYEKTAELLKIPSDDGILGMMRVADKNFDQYRTEHDLMVITLLWNEARARGLID